MTDVLEGYHVLDITDGVAGPIVGMFMSDFGAKVVKIEDKKGDPSRETNPGFACWNRGKLGISLDPESPEDRAWLWRQMCGADVLLVRDDAQLDRWGTSIAIILEANPQLVLCDLPPYVASYTPWSRGDESAELLTAFAGQSARQSSESGDPVDLVYPFVLYAQGLWASVCVTAALVEREASHWGQQVTVTGMNAIEQLYAGTLSVSADSADPNTAIGSGGRHALYGRMRARDGKWLGCGALGEKFEVAAWRALGLGEVDDEPRLKGRAANIFAPENVQWARERVESAAQSRDRDEWLQILESAGVPCGPLLDRRDWLDHPQTRANGLRIEIDDPERGRTVMPGIPLSLSKAMGKVHGHAPMLGEHNGMVEEWTPKERPHSRPPLQAGPLHGVRILDSGTFLAVPYAGSLLAILGADVIKIEPPLGDPARAMGYVYNRGVRSLAIDLQTDDGLEMFYRLIEKSDVFIDGLRPGLTKKLKIDYDTLCTINPNIITTSLSAYGDQGPLSHKGGVDMVLQAMSGLMRAQGGDDDPVASTIAVVDTVSGALIALTAVLAFLHRVRTGDGQRTSVSLAGTATYIQLGELTDFSSRPEARRGGRDYKGPQALDRLYEGVDGWLRVQAARDTDLRTICSALVGETGLLEVTPDEVLLRSLLLSQPVAQSVETLNGIGVPTVAVRKVTQVIRDPLLLQRDYFHLQPSMDGGVLVLPGRLATFSRTPIQGRPIPPGVGEHTKAILLDTGQSSDTIDDLIARGVLAQGGPANHVLAPVYR